MIRGLLYPVAIFCPLLLSSSCLFYPFDNEKIVSGPKIGIVEIRGIIDDSKAILKQIKKFSRESDIRGILIRVDSPGGTVGPIQEIYSEILKVGRRKKIYISIGNIAASGGYYIASAGQKIFSNPGSIVGSISVIMHTVNVEQLVKMLKVDVETIKSGKYKDIGSPFKEMTPEERELLLNVTKEIHHQFIDAVARGRRMDIERVREIADGRIMTGLSAQRLGLVDEIGTIEDAIEMLWRDLNLSGEPQTVSPKRQPSSFIKQLIDSLSEDIEDRVVVRYNKGFSFWFLNNYDVDIR